MRPISTNLVMMTLTLLATFAARAEDFSAAGFDKVVIVAPAAQVVAAAGPSAMVRVAAVPHLSWSAREEGKTLRLTAVSSLASPRSGAIPKVEIGGGAFALDVHLNEGPVQVTKWSKPVLIDVQKGKVIAKDVKSGLSIQVGQGQVNVAAQSGPLRIDIFKGDVAINGLQGNLQLAGHQSEVNVEQASGRLQLQLYQGGADFKSSGGTLLFQTGKASLLASAFKGRIEGEAEEGTVNLGLVPETEAAIKSAAARVVLDTRKSGSLLVLRSEEGDISGSRTMRPGKDRGARVLRGRAKGGDGGRIEVVAGRGSIVIRE